MKNENDSRPNILILEGLGGSADCVRAAGGRPIEIAPYNISGVDEALSGERGPIHGVLLTGGGDVDPRLYGQKPHKKTYGVSETRDLVELVTLDHADDESLPVLGICRGAQIMNVWAGGTLFQDIINHRGGKHAVSSEEHTTFREAAGEEMRVVSLHHQEVDEPGDGMEIVGWSKDNIAEAIESEDGRMLGVQFHPEMDEFADYSKGLFDWLVQAAAEKAGLPKPERDESALEPVYSSYGWGDDDAWVKRGGKWVPYSTTTTTTTTTKKSKGKNRKAGTRTKPVTRVPGITTTWFCRHCAMEFDHIEDRDDHEWYLHDSPLSDTPAAESQIEHEVLQGIGRESRSPKLLKSGN